MNLFQSFFSAVLRRSGLSCLLFFGLFLVCAWGLQFSKLQLDIYDVYNPNFQSSVDLFEIKEAFSDRSQMLVAFSFPGNPTAGELCKLSKWSQEISLYKEVKSVTSIWSVRSPQSRENKLWYPRSLPDPCERPASEAYALLKSFSTSYFQHLISKSGTSELVFDISFSGSESDTSQVQYIINETNAFLDRRLPRVKADYMGMAGFRYYFKKIMLEDSIYNLLILLIILLLMRVLYGTWRSGVYLSITLIGSSIILYGTLSLSGIPIDILTNNLFLMTAVAGTADFIFVSQFQLSGGYEQSFRRLMAPCFFTTLTTFAGFLSLNSSDLSIIRGFGNGAALGALAEWAMMFIFLPSLLKTFNKDRVWVNPEKAFSQKWMEKIESFSLPKSALGIFILLMILSVPSFFYLNDQDSPVENLPKKHVLRKAYENFQEKFGWQGQVYLYFPDVPDKETFSRISENLSKIKLIHRIENPQELVSEWTKNLPPLRQDLIQRELSMTPLWERYYSSTGSLRVPLYLADQDLHSLRRLREQVSSVCGASCRLAGQRIVYLEYGERISRTMIESFAVSILLVLGIMACLLWSFGKLRLFIPVALSSLMGPLAILTLIALFQIPVTLITSIFLAVMVGLAGDNAIQYLFADKDNLLSGIEERSKASIIVTLVMIAGSSMFILQSLLPMKILGVLFISGFFINLLGDLWGLKAMLVKED